MSWGKKEEVRKKETKEIRERGMKIKIDRQIDRQKYKTERQKEREEKRQ